MLQVDYWGSDIDGKIIPQKPTLGTSILHNAFVSYWLHWHATEHHGLPTPLPVQPQEWKPSSPRSTNHNSSLCLDLDKPWLVLTLAFWKKFEPWSIMIVLRILLRNEFHNHKMILPTKYLPLIAAAVVLVHWGEISSFNLDVSNSYIIQLYWTSLHQ